MRRHGGIPPYRETRNYVSRITSRYQALQQAQGRVLAPATRQRVNDTFQPQTQMGTTTQTVKAPQRQRVAVAEKRHTPKKTRKVRR